MWGQACLMVEAKISMVARLQVTSKLRTKVSGKDFATAGHPAAYSGLAPVSGAPEAGHRWAGPP